MYSLTKHRIHVLVKIDKNLEKDVFRLITSVGRRKNSESPWGIEPQTFGFRAPILSLISIHKHDSIDIADPSSMQDVCHMNFVINLTHWRVSVAQWYSIGARTFAESEGLRFHSSWGLKTFFHSQLWEYAKHLSLFLYRAQNLPSLLFYS